MCVFFFSVSLPLFDLAKNKSIGQQTAVHFFVHLATCLLFCRLVRLMLLVSGAFAHDAGPGATKIAPKGVPSQPRVNTKCGPNQRSYFRVSSPLVTVLSGHLQRVVARPTEDTRFSRFCSAKFRSSSTRLNQINNLHYYTNILSKNTVRLCSKKLSGMSVQNVKLHCKKVPVGDALKTVSVTM